MIFESLNEKFQDIFAGLKRKGKLTETDIKAVNREIRLALLEADVNFKVVKQFTKAVSERALGEEVLKSLTPGQQFIKIVHNEMVNLLGGQMQRMDIDPKQTNVFMIVGLQGTGKTTTSGKIANLLRKEKKLSPLLVACDVYRPAAVDQLKVLGKELEIPVFEMGTDVDPREIAQNAVIYAKKNNHNLVIVDTAGRLQIDQNLMTELNDIKELIQPTEVLLIVDGMTGQESVNVANEFNSLLDITGVILTKLDGDTRGGAAMSIAYSTGKSIRFIGTGEKLSDIELFYPDRMASRILGMGDVLSLIDKAQSSIDADKAKALEAKLKTQDFDFNDFLEQLEQIKEMGSMTELLEMMPGINKKALKGMDFSEDYLVKSEAIIQSMTPEERRRPNLINGSRRKRIAAGSGTSVSDINRLMKNFEQSKKMLKQMTHSNKAKKGRFKLPFM